MNKALINFEINDKKYKDTNTIKILLAEKIISSQLAEEKVALRKLKNKIAHEHEQITKELEQRE